MSIDSVCLNIDEPRYCKAALQYALMIAESRGAPLSGFHRTQPVDAVSMAHGEAMAPAVLSELQEQAEQAAADAKALFTEGAGQLDSPTNWIEIDGARPDAAISVVAYTDLIVTGMDNEGSNKGAITAADLVTESGRPVLVVPQSAAAPDTLCDHVMIAWKESPEAARAVSDAMPFLKMAKKVTIATVSQDNAEPAAAALREMLKRKECSADVLEITDQKGAKTSEQLLAAAETCGATMLVAGAYSRSRLLEGLFGGVTQTLLETTPLPCLMAH